MKTNPPLSTGYSPVPRGKIASVVTCLDMTERPKRRSPRPMTRPLALERFSEVSIYRRLYQAIGQDWLWFSRLVMPEDELATILAHPDVETFALMEGKRRIGLLELDFRQESQCELAFFGLAPQAIGQGAGRYLMDQAIARAFARPIRRLWVHTCTLDHPAALGFYLRSGFCAYERMVELADDPRITGHLPREAAPQIPLIEIDPSEI